MRLNFSHLATPILILALASPLAFTQADPGPKKEVGKSCEAYSGGYDMYGQGTGAINKEYEALNENVNAVALKGPAIYFMFGPNDIEIEPISKSTKEGDPVNFFTLSEKIKTRLKNTKESANVKIYNRSGMASIYFMPTERGALHNVSPKTAMDHAIHIGRGCTIQNFSGREMPTLMGNDAAFTADKIVYDQRMAESRNPNKMTASETNNFNESVGILKSKFEKEFKLASAGKKGPDRSPASLEKATDHPVDASYNGFVDNQRKEKKLKPNPIGSAKKNTVLKPASDSKVSN
jgi:hypothetical protein